jgi:hypothetical protein
MSQFSASKAGGISEFPIYPIQVANRKQEVNAHFFAFEDHIVGQVIQTDGLSGSYHPM